MSEGDQKPNKKLNQHEQRINKFIQKPLDIDNNNLDQSIKDSIKQRNTFMNKVRYWNNIRLQFMNSKYYRQKVIQINRFSKESLPMLLFVGFSSFMIWKMEGQYDKMRQQIHNIKTYHEREVEKEDEYIRRVLSGQKPNIDVQIKEPKEQIQKYKFQDDEEDDDENPGFDTKDDFYKGIQKDIQAGNPVPEKYKEDLQRYKQGKSERSIEVNF